MAEAVGAWSPVTMITRIPADWHSLIDGPTSSLAGSSKPISPKSASLHKVLSPYSLLFYLPLPTDAIRFLQAFQTVSATYFSLHRLAVLLNQALYPQWLNRLPAISQEPLLRLPQYLRYFGGR